MHRNNNACHLRLLFPFFNLLSPGSHISGGRDAHRRQARRRCGAAPASVLNRRAAAAAAVAAARLRGGNTSDDAGGSFEPFAPGENGGGLQMIQVRAAWCERSQLLMPLLCKQVVVVWQLHAAR
jgi:hypothetical protein